MKTLLTLGLTLTALIGCTRTDHSPEPPASPAEPAPRVYVIEPAEGAEIQGEVTVRIGAEGVTVEPAGTVREGAGHLHVLIDVPYVEAGQVVPKDEHHIHLGTGATETTLALPPGPHTIRVQLADGAHTALPGLRAEVHVTVVE